MYADIKLLYNIGTEPGNTHPYKHMYREASFLYLHSQYGVKWSTHTGFNETPLFHNDRPIYIAVYHKFVA